MKKIINGVDQVENEMIQGMVKAYPNRQIQTTLELRSRSTARRKRPVLLTRAFFWN